MGVAPVELLIVEDEQVIGKALQQSLREAGHGCVWAKEGDRGLALATSQKFDAIVLDIMLPDASGLDLLCAVRGQGFNTPVILLTALGSVEELVAGLNAGADDYMVKPLAFAELMARIEAICRRTATRPTAMMQVGELTLDLSTRRVSRPDGEVKLTSTEFNVLELLVRHAGQVVTRKMLCEHVWGFAWDGNTNVIEVHINRVRGKLDRKLNVSPIETVRGRGYVIRVS
jgi:two-component system, OmpR family, response regulator